MLTFQQVRSKVAADVVEQTTTNPENKRLLPDRSEHDLVTTESTKRRKLAEVFVRETKETIDGYYAASSMSSSSSEKKKVDPTELASAFALASLANLSPSGSSVGSASPPRESREANIERKEKGSKIDDEVRKAASFESEARSPKASEHPTSPEQRFQRDVTNSPASSNRRVSFAPNTKAAEDSNTTPSTPVSSNKEKASSSPSRSLVMPQQSPRGNYNNGGSNSNSNMMMSPNTMMQMSPRPHRMYGGRGVPPFVRTPPQSHQMQGHRLGYGTPPPPPHAPYHHPSSHRVLPRGVGGPIPPGSFRHGPPSLHHPHLSPHQQYAYSMGSPSYRFHPQQQNFPPRQLMQPPLMHRTNSSGMAMGPPEPPNQKGAASTNCNQWICDFCNVASFSTYEEACAHEDICKRSGPTAAALMSMSMSRSYSSASADEDSVAVPNSPMMMSGNHLNPHNPQFHPGFNGAMAVRRHRASMALKLGHQQHRMMDVNNTNDGNNNRSNKPSPSSSKKGNSREEQQPMTEEERRRQELHLHSLGGHIVYSNDVEMIPPYVHFLMRQVEPCLFTESDRFVARSKGPVGYPGFQCRHCNGHAGLGKYFPVSSKSLSTNSTSQNIHAHMLKCRKCPEPVKDQLVQLKIEKSRAARLEPGWRKIFFDKVWQRLHGEAGDNCK
jgi:hypothetical protein